MKNMKYTDSADTVPEGHTISVKRKVSILDKMVQCKHYFHIIFL